MMSVVQLVLAAVAALLLLSSSTAQSIAKCGIGPFDLTSLQDGPDIVFISNNLWAVHPCGNVSTATSCTGTFCQDTVTVAHWNSSAVGNSASDYASYNVDNEPIWAIITRGLQVGVAQIIQDGDSCYNGIGDRQGMIEYMCNPNATTAYISAAWETITCHYTATIQTNVTCGVTLEAALAADLPLVSTQCGGGLYDLSAFEIDLFWDVPTNPGAYIVHPCGAIQNENATGQAANFGCSNNGLSVCQPYYTEDVSTYAPYYYPVVYQPLVGGGLAQIIQDGTADGGAERFINISYVCDPTYSTPTITSTGEGPQYHYFFNIAGAALCNQTMTIPTLTLPSATNCKYGPFDLNPITDTLLTTYTNGYQWLIRPCGYNTDFGYCPGQFCQGSTTVDYYNDSTSNSAQYQSATGSVSTPYWAAATLNGMSGVAQIIQDGTEGGDGARQGAIYYLCDETATTPVFDTAYENPGYHYNAIVLTDVVCGVSTSALQQPGVSLISDICGGGIYDLSSLSADITGSFSGYMWTVNLCAPLTTINSSACNTGGASVCQWIGDANDPGYSTSLTYYTPGTYPTVWTYLGNGVGVSQFIQDGPANCGGTNTDRQTNISVICNKAATTPIMTAAYQLQECWYDIIIESDAVCSGPLFAAAPGAPGGSSSSSAAPAAASSSSSAVSAAPASSSSSAAAVSAGSSSSAASAGAASSSSAVSAASAASSSSIATTSAASALSSAATSAPSSAATSSPAAASSSTSTVAAASVTSSSSSAAAAAAVTSSSSAPAAASSSAATFVTSSTAPPPPAGVVSSSSSTAPPPVSPTSTVFVSSVPAVPSSSTGGNSPFTANGASSVRLTGVAVVAAAVAVAVLLL